jgi:hypothetical protein
MRRLYLPRRNLVEGQMIFGGIFAEAVGTLSCGGRFRHRRVDCGTRLGLF